MRPASFPFSLLLSACLLGAAGCGPDPTSATTTESEGTTDPSGTSDSAIPAACESDPEGDDCRTAYHEQCQTRATQEECHAEPAVGYGGGSNLWCAWLEPVRWTVEGDACIAGPEPVQCVGGDFVGDGGSGCLEHFDPDDPGPGLVVGVSERCAGPYTWVSCLVEDAPPECTCVGL